MTDALCTQCALCCDGTFFGSVVIAGSEVPRLARVGLPIVSDNGKLLLPQACRALDGCSCTVYADRPEACGAYACTLRKRVTAGECALDDAMRTVGTMHGLLATVRGAFGATGTTSIWETIIHLEETQTESEREVALRDYETAAAAVAELLTLGRAEFEPTFAGGSR